MAREDDYYSLREVTRILQKPKEVILQEIEAGELEAEQRDGSQWRIPARALHERLLPYMGKVSKAPQPPQRVIELEADMRALETDMKHLQHKLEQTEAERDEAHHKVTQLKEELLKVQQNLRRADEELRIERSKGFWVRLRRG